LVATPPGHQPINPKPTKITKKVYHRDMFAGSAAELVSA
jgi:hypothetical protein